jgi:hypothetical protein
MAEPTMPQFPIIGFAAPVVAAGVLYLFLQSPFVIVGGVLAPLMVLAHFFDSKRRVKREQAAAGRKHVLAMQSFERDRLTRLEAERARANRLHPSVSDCATTPGWVAPLDGRQLIRAGTTSVYGHPGFPWLVDVSGGVAVTGNGLAAEKVWRSLALLTEAAQGDPKANDTELVWPSGVRLVRGHDPEVAVSIHCSGSDVVSITKRGELPDIGEWETDEFDPCQVLPAVKAAPVFEGPGIGRVGSSNLLIDPTSDSPHFLIAGRTGSGKSELLTLLIIDWAERFSPEQLTIIGIDFKGGATFSRLAGLPHLVATVTDLNAGLLPRVFAGISFEIRRRETLFANLGVRRIEDYLGLPRLVIAIEEYHEVIRIVPAFSELVSDIARRGRSLGIHLVIVTQHPSGVVKDAVLVNIPVRISLALNTASEVASVIGEPARVVPGRGEALVRLDSGAARIASIANNQFERLQKLNARWRGVTKPDAPWREALLSPVLATDPAQGEFGILDDIENASHRPAFWSPAVGDVWICGATGSGRSLAIRALTAGWESTVFSDYVPGHNRKSLVVIDDVNLLQGEAGSKARADFEQKISLIRGVKGIVVVAAGTNPKPPRMLGTFRNTLLLRMDTLEDHREAGGQPWNFDPNSEPGVGLWNGTRVALYASTDSSETASIP